MRHFRKLTTVLFFGCLLAAGCGDSAGTDSEREAQAPLFFPLILTAGKNVDDANCGRCHDSSRDGAPRRVLCHC